MVLKSYNIDPIFLLSPTTTDERIKKISDAGSGFLYYVSLKGVTGSKDVDLAEVTEKVNQLKNKLGLPIGIGFGIRDSKTAEQMAQVGDAIIVGSALVQLIEDNQKLGKDTIKKAISSKMKTFKKAIQA